ncbi:hypothetical protein EV360DRAFT_72154 [Lentinula raphanica]|nr:hypothetical protein EV360DRAFT_72154 [Lentinula raphanica]
MSTEPLREISENAEAAASELLNEKLEDVGTGSARDLVFGKVGMSPEPLREIVKQYTMTGRTQKLNRVMVERKCFHVQLGLDGYGSQNSQQYSLHQLLSEAGLSTEWINEVFDASNVSNVFDNTFPDVFSDTHPCHDVSGVDRPLGWAAVDSDINIEPPELKIELNANEITILLTLITNAKNVPRIIYALDLPPQPDHVISKGGVPVITAMAAVSLAKSREVELPDELRLSLHNLETTLATAGGPPVSSFPVDLLSNYRLLSTMSNVMTSDSSLFEIYPASQFHATQFMFMGQQPKVDFVLILIQPPIEPSTGLSGTTVCPSSIRLLGSTSLSADVRNEGSTSLAPQVESPRPLNALSNLPNTDNPSIVHEDTSEQANVAVFAETMETPHSELAPPSPSSFQALNVDAACERLEINKPHGTWGPKGRRRTISILVQDWQNVRELVLALGYKEQGVEGGMDVQKYEWADGTVETYEEILKGLNWSTDDYEIKTGLYLWAIEATATKVWNRDLPLPTDEEERRKVKRARRTWRRLCYFFTETEYQYHGHPDLSQRGTKEYSLKFLNQSVMKKSRKIIKSRLIDRT